MKWLKLDCDFRNDPKIRAISRLWGGEKAAGFWTLLLAFVGAHGGPECKVRIREGTAMDDRAVADWFTITTRSLHDRLTTVARLGLIDESAWTGEHTISIPNMLKRVDDYTRKVRTKSGHATDFVLKNPPVEEEEEEEREEEGDKEVHRVPKTLAGANGTVPRYTADFDAFWVLSTKRGSKLEAFREWRKLKPSPELTRDIHAGMLNWMQSEQWQDETKQPHVFRWLKRHGWGEIIPRSQTHGKQSFEKESHAERVARKNRATAALFDGPPSDATGDGKSPGSHTGASRPVFRSLK